MKHSISNILSINKTEILIPTTVMGSLLQIICRRYQHLHPELENETNPYKIELEVNKPKQLGKIRLQTLIKFLAKNG